MKKLFLIISFLSLVHISFSQQWYPTTPNILWTTNFIGISSLLNFTPLEKLHVRDNNFMVDHYFLSEGIPYQTITLFACADPNSLYVHRVGILTKEPTQALHVQGDIRLGNSGSNGRKLVFGISGENAQDYFEFFNRQSNSTLPFFNIYWRDQLKLSMKVNGYLGLGTSDPQALLHLNDGDLVISNNNLREFKVTSSGYVTCRQVDVTVFNIPDFVFNTDYKLISIIELDSFINKNHHLPGITSAKEYQELGVINIGEMNQQLLMKIEELTLYIIQLNKQIEFLKANMVQIAK